MASQIRHNTVWKDLHGVFVNVDGVWKQASAVFVNVDGVWKQAIL